MDNITKTDAYDLRYSEQDDLPYLQEWAGHCEVMRYLPVSTPEDVMMMTKNWIGFSRFKSSLTATYEGKPVGIATLFLMPYRKLIHHALVYFVVDPGFLRRGVGRSLIRNITHLGKSYFHLEKLCVETYEGCPAIPILEQEGYKESIRQERFVKEGENKYLARVVLEG